MKVGKLYYFRWVDATSSERWKTLEELDEWALEMGEVDQVGWLLSKDKDKVIICGQRSMNIDPPVTGQHHMIRRADILEYKELKCT